MININFIKISSLHKWQNNRIIPFKCLVGNWFFDASIVKNNGQCIFFSPYTLAFNSFSRKPSIFPFQWPSSRASSLVDFFSTPDSMEIKRALFDFTPYKSPRPDGLHHIFFQMSKVLVGITLCNWVQQVFLLRIVLENANSTLLCLIPKVSSPENFSQ